MDQEDIVEEVFVNVVHAEGSDDVIELPCDEHGQLLLSTVQAQFPFAIGVKYRSDSGGWRGVKAENNTMDPPSGGWTDRVYVVSESAALKRKVVEDEGDKGKKKSRKSAKLLEDLIILGIPFTTTQEELFKYLTDNCGEVVFCDLKVDRETKKSRGFGFVRFVQEEAAQLALDGHHEIEGRKLEIRLSRKKPEVPMKLFIGRLVNGTTKDDVEEYFSDFGDLTDVFVPNGRGFGFVTFADQEDGKKVLRLEHCLKGSRLNVVQAVPKEEGNPNKPEPPSSQGYTTRNYGQQQNKPGGEQAVSNDAASELKDMLLQLISNS